VDKINALDPDVILLPGDIVDEALCACDQAESREALTA